MSLKQYKKYVGHQRCKLFKKYCEYKMSNEIKMTDTEIFVYHMKLKEIIIQTELNCDECTIQSEMMLEAINKYNPMSIFENK